MPLDRDVRIFIEEVIDDMLEDPELYFESYKEGLMTLGIQPTLETVLAYISGIVTGAALGRWVMLKRRYPTPKELTEMVLLLSRRAKELREEFIKMFYK